MMTTKKKHSLKKTKRQQRVVPVYEGRGRARLVSYAHVARASAPAPAPAPAPESESESESDGLEGDENLDVPSYDQAFEPAPEDDADLRWYFGLGQKRSPQWLSPSQQRKWWRINRSLDSEGRALCLYYTNPMQTERALAPAVGEPWLYCWRLYSAADEYLSRPTNSDECAAFVHRVVTRRATARPQSAALRHDTQRVYSQGRDAAEDALFDSVRQRVVEKLTIEYQTYLERKAKRSEQSDAVVFPRAPAVAYLGQNQLLNRYIPTGLVTFSTWGDIRISVDCARRILDDRVAPGGRPTPAAAALVVESMREAMRAALEAESWRERIATEDGADRRGRFAALRDIADGAECSVKHNGLPNQDALNILELVRTERGRFDRRTGRYENDPRLLEIDPTRPSTTVTEVAAIARIPAKHARALLQKLACPGATVMRGELPTAWFSSDIGGDFWAEAKEMRRSIARSGKRKRG